MIWCTKHSTTPAFPHASRILIVSSRPFARSARLIEKSSRIRSPAKTLTAPVIRRSSLTMLRSGDTLVVKSLDRLSRSKADIHSELQWFKENNIHLKVIDLPTTMMDLPPGTGMGIRDGQQHSDRSPRHDRRAGASRPFISDSVRASTPRRTKANTSGGLPLPCRTTGRKSLRSGKPAKSPHGKPCGVPA